jgi:2-polyprenyl-6-methoxyphenol hydroxylase-like FAD-dependent oxidoreductase
MMAHRVRVHEALKEKALAADGVSHPCELRLSSSVVDVDPETATITLQDGTKVTGDVVIGADGVHSKARCKVPEGDSARPFPSGKSAFRFMIERQDALDDPATHELCAKKGVFTVAVGVDRRIIMYDTVNNTLLNFVCIHPDSESDAGEGWDSGTSKSALLHVYRDWAPAFQAILSKANPESLKIWKLLDMKNLPAWYDSRLALIGDAAHPFLPHQGQGAAIAIEDAVALGTVLERGLRPEEVPDRLKLYNDIRYERACKVQQLTRLAGLDVQDGKLDSK